MAVEVRKAVDSSKLWWTLRFPQIRGEDKHIEREGRIQGVAEDSGNKLRKPVYGSRELYKCSERLLNMEGPLRPRLVNCSDFQFGVVATETIENALLHLAQQNEQAVKEAAGRTGSFRETRIVGVDAEWGVGFTGDMGALTFVFHSNILLVLLLCDVVGLISDERGLLALLISFPLFPAHPGPSFFFFF